MASDRIDMQEKVVLAIDPGTQKCGMALVRRGAEGEIALLWRAIAPKEMVIPKLHQAYAYAPFSLVVIGSGTGSKDVIAGIRKYLPSMGMLVVDEKETTLQARERYWEYHPRRGWRRFLPATLQTPPQPVDDFVAMILAERVLQGV